MLGGEDIIDTADGRGMGCRLHQIRISFGLFGNLSHHGDETIERLLRFVLRGLDHQRLVEE